VATHRLGAVLAVWLSLAGAGTVALTGCGSAVRPSSPAGPAVAAAPAAIPAALAREARPIGHGAAFHPGAHGSVPGACRRDLGRRLGVHVELFAADRVVLVAAGIGVRPPIRRAEGRIAGARCFGELVTLEPTGVVLLRPGARLTLADLFRAWNQPLSTHRLASFRAGPGRRVRIFVDGRPRPGGPGAVRLRPHSEIVLEVGPYVPPHASYRFPPGS
jgi:hypothetical protein